MKKVFCLLSYLIAVSGIGAVPALAHTEAGGVKSLEKRIEQLEDAVSRQVDSQNWYDRIRISGLVQVEATFESIDDDDPTIGSSSSGDVDLATVELAVDAKIAPRVDGHVLLKYEEDELLVDEGFLTLSGPDSVPAFLIAGRQYIPFGYFDSHFVTDPLTLSLGETNEGALVAGYRPGSGRVDFSIAVFNSKSDTAGSDDTISSYAGRIMVTPLEGIKIGASFTSSLAAADALNEQVQGDLKDDVAAWSAFASVTWLRRLNLVIEYVGAVESFKAGELYAAGDTKARRPEAWNLELGCAVADGWEIAVRYAGSADGEAAAGRFLPETQYGAVVNWDMFQNAGLALEYLHADFQSDRQSSDTVVAQLAVEF